MEKKITIRIEVGEDGCFLKNDLMGEDSFCDLDRDDDSVTVAEKILKSLGFEVEIIDQNE